MTSLSPEQARILRAVRDGRLSEPEPGRYEVSGQQIDLPEMVADGWYGEGRGGRCFWLTEAGEKALDAFEAGDQTVRIDHCLALAAGYDNDNASKILRRYLWLMKSWHFDHDNWTTTAEPDPPSAYAMAPFTAHKLYDLDTGAELDIAAASRRAGEGSEDGD